MKKILFLTLFLILPLSSCGVKGPLYHPKQSQQPQQPKEPS